MLRSLGLRHRFFRPLLRRVLTVAAIVIYGLVELFYGHPAWAAFALCLTALCSYAFFVNFQPQEQGNHDV